jgi:hypothetical protein
MNKNKSLVLVVTFAMMAATGLGLEKLHRRVRPGAPGVKVGRGLLYDEAKHLVAQQCVLLPDTILGLKGQPLPVTRLELDSLPKDTTFGRKEYADNGFSVETSVVLMGTDRSSIHQPEYCLESADWHIVKKENVHVPVDRPYMYEIPALKLTASRMVLNENKKPMELRGVYIYWFVTDDKITSEEGARMWSLAKTMVEKGKLERWAYIAYFSTCLPGQEDATFERMKGFIRASTPEFQTVAGPSSAHAPMALR